MGLFKAEGQMTRNTRFTQPLHGHLSPVNLQPAAASQARRPRRESPFRNVLLSRCSQQKLPGLAEEMKPVAAPAMHPLPTPLLPSSLTMSPEAEAEAELWLLLWHRTTMPAFYGETQKLLRSTEQHLREQRCKTWAACRQYMKVPHVVKAQASRLPEDLVGPETCNNCDESWDQGWAAAVMRDTHQSPMWVWGPFSRWQTCFYLSTASHARCWEERPLEQGQHGAPQGGAGREAAALHIPGPEGQLTTLALEDQLTKVPS